MASKKEDILAFLDSKFGKLEKKDKKKRDKVAKTIVADTPIMDAIAQSKALPTTSETLYASLASETELKTKGGDSLGVRAFKEFHLKESERYDKDIKDKIFFIA